MLTTTLKGIAGHKRRVASTCVAVVLGVTFLTATLVLGATVRGGFDQLFSEANEGTAAVVRSATRIGGSDTGQNGVVDPAVVDEVRAVPGVAAAEPVVTGLAQIVARDGATIGGNGPPTLGAGWIDDPALEPYRIAEGRAPADTPAGQPVEVVIDRGAADDAGFAVGDTTTVLVPDQVPVRIVGIATFGDADSAAGVTWTGFAPAEAARLLGGGRPGVTEIRVAAEEGVGQDELATRIGEVVPADTEVLTGKALTAEQLDDIDGDFLGMMRTLLVVFAGVALLVASFSIHNTFAIVAAQRGRESALLRAIGATRGQVLASSVIEALLVGVLATAVGLAVGVGLAQLLAGVLETSDVGLPVGDLVIDTASVVAPVAVGLGVTLLAALGPALQSSRISPLQAMRATAVESGRTGPARIVAGLVTAVVGVASLVDGTTGDGDPGRVGLGSLLTIVAFVLLGPVVARPLGRLLGAPGRLLKGVTGQLAQENAVRNPRRTAGTATALVVGIGVVVVFTVFAASLRSSIDAEVARSFGDTDLVVRSDSFGGAGLSSELVDGIGTVGGVDTVATLAYGDVAIDGLGTTAAVTEPDALDRVSDLRASGDPLAALGDDGIAVSDTLAEERGWTLGSPVELGFADGSTVDGHVATTFPVNGSIGDLVVSRSLWDAHSTQALGPQVVLVGVGDGADVEAVQAEVRELAAAAGSPPVETRQEYVDYVGGQVNQMLVIVYVLLAVAVLIALLGIANTLTLSIHERTRELGVLRAVGQSRRQLRSMIRWESAVVATFGSLAGIGLGVLVGWGLVRSVGQSLALSVVSIPVAQLAVILVVGGAAGVLAAVRPARRASRLSVLTAIAGD